MSGAIPLSYLTHQIDAKSGINSDSSVGGIQGFVPRKLEYIEYPIPKVEQGEHVSLPNNIDLKPLPEPEVLLWLQKEQKWTHSGKIQLITQEWSSQSFCNGNLADTPIPFSESVYSTLVERSWLTAEWTSLWHNNAGGSGALVDVAAGRHPGFIVQTPNDNGPFCSISVATLKHGTGGVWIADKNININFLLQNQRYDFNSHIGYDFILLPIRLLEWHVSYIGRQLTELQKKMAKVEQDIASGRRPTNYTELSSALNVCSSLQLTLDRRWMFEKALAHNLLKYFKAIEPDPVTHHSHFSSHLPPQVTTYPYPPSSIQRVKFHLQLSSGYEYDINILPQRIKLQQDAVRNLVDVGIAESTRQIAMESRRDSSSMKTIAVLTLIFLPGTFVSAFFSMTMFNWQPESGHPAISGYIWVYFLITIPLTILVVMAWFAWHRSQEKKMKDGVYMDV